MLHRNKVTSMVRLSEAPRSVSTAHSHDGPVDAADVAGAAPGQILPD